MADTRISKIKVRQGNFSDLPNLDPGEFGFAKDQRRLFIGNDTVSVGTGNGILTQFTVPIGLTEPSLLRVFVNGTAVNASDFTLSGTTLTFSTAPTGAITVGFNSEIDLGEDVPVQIQLAANGNNADTGFSVITTQHNIVIMDYTLESTNGVRVGQLKFATDTSASTSTIDDIFTETGTVGIVFNLNIATPNIMKLQYTDSDNLISNFKYTYQSWNSS
tara:strand:+ start:1884 stop:2537 length:654 start_codon:yes stop_codon:yes gene_type:complete